MSTAFETACKKTLGVEGEYSNVLGDSGGRTRWGITEVVARVHGYLGPMQALPLEVAKKIYFEQWWTLLNLERVSGESQAVAEEVFDTAVNCGQMIAAKFLQRALNTLNREEKDYQDVRVDGLIGPMTIHALHLYLLKRHADGGEVVLLRILNGLQVARYVEIAESPVRKKDEKFTFGWIKNRVRL